VAEDVTNEVNDLQQLANVALEAKANLELTRTEVVADAGYYNASEVSRCLENGITPFIPKSDTSANSARGLYGKSQFKYDATKDVYICPAGDPLTYRFATVELDRELKYYRASNCKTCALKSRCTRNKGILPYKCRIDSPRRNRRKPNRSNSIANNRPHCAGRNNFYFWNCLVR
jgi:hypothetical protein